MKHPAWILACLLAGAAAAEPPGISGRVLCGYQGWFACPGDGSGRGWVHWSRDRSRMAPGTATVDLWPDVSEFAPEDRFDTDFAGPDGKPAQVFSSYRAGTVNRHFRWMREQGIDGVFIQRFASGLHDPHTKSFNDTVLGHCREAAREHDRAWAVMYDLSGLQGDALMRVADDWAGLREVAGDPGYLHHGGRPLVAIWGVGFSDRRGYDVASCGALVDAMKRQGVALMLGVPAYWRSGTRDAVPDPALKDICGRADIISPWTVGRYRDDKSLAAYASIMKEDVAWCRERGLTFLPVVFPGFSWHNLHGGASAEIPRQGGRFLWSQFTAVREAGLKEAYVAMFDEVDEGTAIIPCVRNPPEQPGSKFIQDDFPRPGHYLWLTGQGGRMLRGEIPPAWPDFGGK